MYRALCLITLLACLPGERAFADPIHAVGGGYWHHDSRWVFAAKVGDFECVGIPQDVAGSEDAVAHYAFVEDGVRHTASVNVYRASSSAVAELEAAPAGKTSDDGAFLVSEPKALYAIRRIYANSAGAPSLIGLYVINAGEWRVTIRISGSRPEAMDAFVRAQRWESLGG